MRNAVTALAVALLALVGPHREANAGEFMTSEATASRPATDDLKGRETRSAGSCRLPDQRLSMARTQIGNRVALAAALAEGKGILEIAPHGLAAEEITPLAIAILKRAAG